MSKAPATRNDDEVRLRYVGDGGFVPGVPTTDLVVTAAEADRLTATGLYEIVADAPAPVEEGDTA